MDLIKSGSDTTSENIKKLIEAKRKEYTDSVEYKRYITYDCEADVSNNTHKPNHVDADLLMIGDNHNYEECKLDTYAYSGYDVVNRLCSWLFRNENA